MSRDVGQVPKFQVFPIKASHSNLTPPTTHFTRPYTLLLPLVYTSSERLLGTISKVLGAGHKPLLFHSTAVPSLKNATPPHHQITELILYLHERSLTAPAVTCGEINQAQFQAKMSTSSRAPGGGAGQTQILQPPPLTPQITTQTRQAVLHLRGATREQERESGGEEEGTSTRRRIQWAEGVVDNEGLGRKKSKVCCIYHAPKGIDESSDESSSDSDSDSDSGDDGAARPAGGKKKACGHGHGHNHGSGGKGKGKGKEGGRARSPNAYEKMPKVKGAAKEK